MFSVGSPGTARQFGWARAVSGQCFSLLIPACVCPSPHTAGAQPQAQPRAQPQARPHSHVKQAPGAASHITGTKRCPLHSSVSLPRGGQRRGNEARGHYPGVVDACNSLLRSVQHQESSQVGSVGSHNNHSKASPHHAKNTGRETPGSTWRERGELRLAQQRLDLVTKAVHPPYKVDDSCSCALFDSCDCPNQEKLSSCAGFTAP